VRALTRLGDDAPCGSVWADHRQEDRADVRGLNARHYVTLSKWGQKGHSRRDQQFGVFVHCLNLSSKSQSGLKMAGPPSWPVRMETLLRFDQATCNAFGKVAEIPGIDRSAMTIQL
jgi:hypothetical protein